MRDHGCELPGAELLRERLCDVHARSKPPHSKSGSGKSADYSNAAWIETRSDRRSREGPFRLRSAPRQGAKGTPHLTPRSEAVPQGEKKPTDEEDVKEAMNRREKKVERGDA